MDIINQIQERKHNLVKLKDKLIIELYNCDEKKRFELIKKIENLVGAINEDDFLVRMLKEAEN